MAKNFVVILNADNHIRLMYIGNYIEQVAYLVASINNTVEFIFTCFADA